MRYIYLLLILPCLAYGEPIEYVYAVHDDGRVTDVMVYSPKNEATLISIFGADKVKRQIKDSAEWTATFGNFNEPPNPLKYNKGIVVDTVAKSAEKYSQTIAEKIDIKQKIIAINELLKSTEDVKEIDELNNQKSELELKVNALEAK